MDIFYIIFPNYYKQFYVMYDEIVLLLKRFICHN